MMNHVVRDVFLFHFFLSILLITQGESLWDFHKLGCFECSKRALKLKVNKTTRKLYYLTHPFRGRQFQGRSAAQRSHQRPTFFPSFLSSSSSWLDRSSMPWTTWTYLFCFGLKKFTFQQINKLSCTTQDVSGYVKLVMLWS